MKTIIRIEHPSDGKGIWRSKDKDGDKYIDSLSNYWDFDARHCKFPNPTYEGDVTGFIAGIHYCAFKSIEQLQEWVYKNEIKELLEMGFKVYMLDVSNWLEGNYQICYKKEDILQQKDISELFK